MVHIAADKCKSDFANSILNY